MGKVNELARIVHAALVERQWQVAVIIARYPGEQPLSLAGARSTLADDPLPIRFQSIATLRQVFCGEVPAEVVRDACGGLIEDSLPLTLPELFSNEAWDGCDQSRSRGAERSARVHRPAAEPLVFGLAGREFLNAASRIALLSGWENNIANLVAPLRQCLFWADKNAWPANLPRWLDIAVVWGNNFRGERSPDWVLQWCGEESYLQAALLSRAAQCHRCGRRLTTRRALFPGLRFASLWDVQQLLPRLIMTWPMAAS